MKVMDEVVMKINIKLITINKIKNNNLQLKEKDLDPDQGKDNKINQIKKITKSKKKNK
jgi:hypothetical protein